MISILGCSGVGKSTVINELVKLSHNSCVYAENMGEILDPISQVSFMRPYDKFLATQSEFMQRDIKALANIDASQLNIFDNRLSEYVFHLLHHPAFSCYKEESEKTLKGQIESVLAMQGVQVFYLTDDIANIKLRVENDAMRTRGAWPSFIEHMYPFHERWHRAHGATVINVKGKESAEVARIIYDSLS